MLLNRAEELVNEPLQATQSHYVTVDRFALQMVLNHRSETMKDLKEEKNKTDNLERNLAQVKDALNNIRNELLDTKRMLEKAKSVKV